MRQRGTATRSRAGRRRHGRRGSFWSCRSESPSLLFSLSLDVVAVWVWCVRCMLKIGRTAPPFLVPLFNGARRPGAVAAVGHPSGKQWAHSVGRVLQRRCAPSGPLDSCLGMGWNSRQRRRAIPLQLRPRHPSIAGPITGPIALSPGESEGEERRSERGGQQATGTCAFQPHGHTPTPAPATKHLLLRLLLLAWTFCCALLQLWLGVQAAAVSGSTASAAHPHIHTSTTHTILSAGAIRDLSYTHTTHTHTHTPVPRFLHAAQLRM